MGLMHAYGWRFDFEEGLPHGETIWNGMYGDPCYSLHNHMTFFYTIISFYDVVIDERREMSCNLS